MTLTLLSASPRLYGIGESVTLIWYSQYDGTRWSVNVRVPGQLSSAAPALAPFSGRLQMAWKGSGATKDLFTASTDGVLSAIRLGFKMVGTAPTPNIATLLTQMRQVYAALGFQVVETAPRETINVPGDIDIDIDVDTCRVRTNTAEVRELMSHRNNLGPRDVAVYVVNSIRTPTPMGTVGCASHPSSAPGCVILPTVNGFTLGHEVGHVLGLRHINDSNNVMFATTSYTNLPPDLTYAQALSIADDERSIE